MTTKVLVAPVGSLEAHCAGLALEAEGLDVTCVPTDDVEAVVLFADSEAALSSAELFEDGRDRPVLLVSRRVDGPAADRARRAGAAAHLPWDASTQRVADAVDRIVAGERMPASAGSDPWSRLTARERQIVGLLKDGASNEAIATALGISYHTVRTHVAHVLAKLGVSHRYAVATVVRGQLQHPGRGRTPAPAGGAP